VENKIEQRKKSGATLGINGLGRIGKLTLWHHIGRKYFDEIIINMGRKVGKSLEDLASYVENDSTYGTLQWYLYGHKAGSVITDFNEEKGTMKIDGIPVTILRDQRNPKEIPWASYGVKVVVDATGQFLDPTVPADNSKGSLRGHLDGGARKVIASAPFKIKDKSKAMPDDAVTTVMGINDSDYDPRKHNLISAASCTTSCLAHMIKPLIDHFGAKNILTASMATIHAATSTQEVLDKPPKADATDLRKTRSIFNNIILTSTGAASTLGLVMPEMKQIGFIAESVRVPTSTGSLIILVVNLQEDLSGETIRRDTINNIYRNVSKSDPNGYLMYTDKQNVSSDIIGLYKATTIIEGHETHTRTANVSIDLKRVRGIKQDILEKSDESVVSISITQAVIYGWYDNEMGSYVNILGDRTVSIAENL
jgi:glyceraldehyde 3-phosphate dehydrogenase